MGLSRPFLGILCALFLLTSACSSTPIVEVLPEFTQVVIPPQNKTCPSIPNPPVGDAATQRDVAAWLPDVYAAHAHCKSDLRATVRIVDAHNAEAERLKAENAVLAK